MISAQNHRLPLSGNKILFLLLVFVITLDSCSIFKKGQTPNPDVILIKDDPKDPHTSGPDTKSDSLNLGTNLPVDTIADPTHAGKKDRYKIALILPFNTSQITQYGDGSNEASFSINEYSLSELDKDAISSLEFYEGGLYALERLAKKGLKVDLNIYDSNKSDFSVNDILEKYELSTMDLIIGPVYNSPSRTVAKFAKENQIYHILPFSPSSSIAEANPYHIKINPTIGVHCKSMFDYIVKNYRDDNVIIYYQPKTNEMLINNMFHELAEAYNTEVSSSGNAFTLQHIMVTEDDDDIEDYLSTEKRNIVIVASFSESFAQNITRKLHFTTKDHEVVVFGMPTWLKSKSLRLDYFESLNVHLTQNFWVDKEDKKTAEFINYFQDNYHTYPSESAFIGYDIFDYFGRGMNEYGMSFFEQMEKEKVKELHTSFMFGINHGIGAGNNDKSSINFFENKYVHLFKFENYELHKMN